MESIEEGREQGCSRFFGLEKRFSRKAAKPQSRQGRGIKEFLTTKGAERRKGEYGVIEICEICG